MQEGGFLRLLERQAGALSIWNSTFSEHECSGRIIMPTQPFCLGLLNACKSCESSAPMSRTQRSTDSSRLSHKYAGQGRGSQSPKQQITWHVNFSHLKRISTRPVTA
ncbi:hypothetical protein AXF42_Ash004214 [Apostasia shenzhenica]|uniref:Uncharacterized protein n=1 Tax=Apostasia shenzhenica TaxID=1088818 RepID=A0A2I0A2C5_9ASPA|nr:hypothetical protein AXF42_Ash004214 [Apostasia shenzhenica]